MNKFESKYQETAKRMDEAFLEILGTKDFEYITVKEICEKASVNRSTFYLHYESLNDLLLECGEYISEKMGGYFKEIPSISDVNSLGEKDLYLITPENLRPWLQSIRDNKRLFYTIFQKGQTIGLRSQYKMLSENILKPILRRFHKKEEDMDYILSFYLKGIMAIIEVWLKEDCNREIDDIIAIITDCVM